MIHESIKAALGAELAAQVEEALKGKGKDGKDVDLVVGNDGSYVAAERVESERGRAMSAEEKLKTVADALKAVGGSGDFTKIAEDVAVIQNQASEMQTQHETEVKRIQRDAAFKLAVADKVHDPDDLLKLVDMESIKVGKDGALKSDVDELLGPIRESKPYLFREQPKAEDAVPPKLSGVTPAAPGQPPAPSDGTAWNPSAAGGVSLNPVFK